MTALLAPDAAWRDWEPEAKTRLRWRLASRPTQRPPEGDWLVWLILAGRGWGKTRTGAEWLAGRAWGQPGTRWAIVAPTYADARDTCAEGESGLLAALEGNVETWNRSLGEIVLRNQSRIKLFSADEPERLRGPQHHGAWCDEPASWRYGPDTWANLQFGLRLGGHPQAVVTGTPKPVRLVRDLVERGATDSAVVVTRGRTADNADNLPQSMLDELTRRYAGTRLGAQELEGELLTDTPGALWDRAVLDAEGFRVVEHPDLQRLVVAMDPAVTSGDEADESGIIVAARSGAIAYVLEDASVRVGPNDAMGEAIDAYRGSAADALVVEANNGGDYLPALAHTIDPGVNVQTVRATRGKALRAEPVAALYREGRVKHLGVFEELEEQMVTWTPDAGWSPDRLDALVWAITALFPELNDGQGRRLVMRR